MFRTLLGHTAYLFNARSLRESSLRPDILTSNPAVPVVIAIMLVLQAGFVYLPFMNAWFDSAPLDLVGWLVPLGLAILVFLLVEVGKAVLRSRTAAPRGLVPTE